MEIKTKAGGNKQRIERQQTSSDDHAASSVQHHLQILALQSKAEKRKKQALMSRSLTSCRSIFLIMVLSPRITSAWPFSPLFPLTRTGRASRAVASPRLIRWEGLQRPLPPLCTRRRASLSPQHSSSRPTAALRTKPGGVAWSSGLATACCYFPRCLATMLDLF